MPLNLEELTDEDATRLAAVLAPKLMPMLSQPGVSVTVQRMHRTGREAGTLAYVDLGFHLGGTLLFTVPGFKLNKKETGGQWLAVPQTKSDTPNADGTDRYRDTFKWENDGIKDHARRVVRAHFDQVGAPNAQ